MLWHGRGGIWGRMGMRKWEVVDIPSSISAFAIQRFAIGRDGVDICCGSAETHLFSLSNI